MRRRLSVLRGSLRTLRRFPLRSGLTILSALLGVAGALSSVNYALGGRQKVVDQLARLGANVLTVTPRSPKRILVTTLTAADYSVIQHDIPGFARSSSFSSRPFLLKAGDFAKNNCPVLGVEPDYFAIRSWPVKSGEIFGSSDLRRAARVVLLGSGVARDLFGLRNPVGKRVLINRVPFQVTGVMSERGQGLDAANEDDQVYIPVTTAMRRLANVDYLGGIVFEATRQEDMDRGADAIRILLRRRHKQIARLGDDFEVQSRTQLIEARTAAANKLLFLVRWIGLSALAVSGLGVLAIAWIGVRERTREIGTRRALGAGRADIFLQIIVEAAVLSLLGCLAGFALGSAGSPLLARWSAQPEIFDTASAWLAAGSSMFLNFIFALIPARAAARLDPIQALQFE